MTFIAAHQLEQCEVSSHTASHSSSITPTAKERDNTNRLVVPASPKSPVKKRNVGIPKFLRFLYEILEKEDKSIITWSHKGTAFQIRKPDALSKGILPRYFKHNKVSSFQRQLNYFGFKKWTKTQTVVCTFSHPYFLRYKPESIKLIKRKERGTTETDNDASSIVADANDNLLLTQVPRSNYLEMEVTSNRMRPWSSIQAPAVEAQQQNYDVFMYGTNGFNETNDFEGSDNIHMHHPIYMPSVDSPQTENKKYIPTNPSANTDSFNAEWGEVLLYTPAPTEQNNILSAPDMSSYLAMWDDEATRSLATPSNNTPFPCSNSSVNNVMVIKLEDMVYDQGNQFDREYSRLCGIPDF